MTSLSERYFRPKAAELDGRIYEWFGVLPFKRTLMRLTRGDPDHPTPNAYALGGTSLEAVRAFEARTRRSELVHGFGLVVALLLLVLAVAGGSWTLGLPGALVLAVNFHCFILQRYNRIRLARVLHRARNQAG